MASAERVARLEAAWRAGWLPDPRVVTLLAKAAKDPERAVARQAVTTLERLGWDAVVALDGSVLTLLADELESGDSDARAAANALLASGAPKALKNLGRALEGRDVNLRRRASLSLVLVNGNAAERLIGKGLDDEDSIVRANAARALKNLNADRGSALLEKALSDRASMVRNYAAEAPLR